MRWNNQKAHNQTTSGFTIIELLVSMVLFTIIMTAVFGLMRVARLDRFSTHQRVEVLQNLRVSLNAIGRDALNAGYGYTINGGRLPDNALNTLFTLSSGTNTSADILMGVVSGRAITTNNLDPQARKSDQVTFVYKDETFNVVNGVSQALSVSAVAANQLTLPAGVSNSGCRTGDIFLIAGQNSNAIGAVTSLTGTNTINFANGDTLNINRTTTTGNVIRLVNTPAYSMTRIFIVTYHVLSDGTLVRTAYGDPAVGTADQPLAYGIENMKIEYVLADGTLTSDPAAGADNTLGTADDTFTNLQNVRQVRVTLAARSPELDQRTNQPYRIQLAGTFNTRNLGYDAR